MVLGSMHQTPGLPTNSPGGAGVRLECHVQSLCLDEHDDIFRNTTEELGSMATPYSNNNEVVELHPTQESREVTPSNGWGVLSDVAVHRGCQGRQEEAHATSSRGHDYD
jgi:hypothetical protein